MEEARQVVNVGSFESRYGINFDNLFRVPSNCKLPP